MRQVLLLLLSLFLLFSTRVTAQPERLSFQPGHKRTPSVEWPTLRANNNRDGRVEAKGEFGSGATLSESVDFSASEAWIELVPGGGSSSVHYRKGDVRAGGLPASLTHEWQGHTTAYVDLYGDGNMIEVTADTFFSARKLRDRQYR